MTDSPLFVSRRDDREAALALLYEAEMTGDQMCDVLDRNHVDVEEYSTTVANGVSAVLPEVDKLIDEVAHDWTVNRMPGIDRCILRMGVWELLHRADVPTTAVVSEAVALANQYSTERSAPFINGVLVKIAATHRDE